MAAPAVSVLLPVRDAVCTLGECLSSLAAQTLADHEVIAVDDGSTDGSRELLAAAAAADPRLRVLATPPRGLVASLQQALAAARAPLVARMDADDLCHPQRLERQAARLRADPAVDVLGCRVLLPAGEGNAGMRAYVEWLNTLLDHEAIVRDLFVESPLAHPSVMMRTATLRGLGYRELFGPEDYDLWLRAHEAGLRFAKVDAALLTWRDLPRRLTRTDPRYAPARFLALKLAALQRTHLRERRPVMVWGAGPVGKGWARALAAAGEELAGFVEVHPRRVGQRIQGVPVVDLAHARRPGALHLGAVGQKGARARLRAAARSLGLVEGRDFLAVA